LKRLKADQSMCEGYQVCVGIAPRVFGMNEEVKVYVKDPRRR
jgi:ferredoxin